MKNIKKFLSMVLCFSMLLTFCSCTAGSNDPATTTDSTEQEEGVSLSEYTIVYTASGAAKYKKAVASMKSQLEAQGVTTQLVGDKEEVSGKKILVGNTSDPASADATASLDANAAHSYVVAVGEDTVAIVGSDTDATLMGMKYFLQNYVSGGRLVADVGARYVGTYEEDVIIFENLTRWVLEETTVVDKPSDANPYSTYKYPTLIELRYQSDESKNGTLLASGERWIGRNNAPIYRSTDRGITWEEIATIRNTLVDAVSTAYAPCLFELPVAVGDMPAGTVILGTNSINSTWTRNYMTLYRSYDAGVTWEAFTTVDYSEKEGNSEFGVWEPNFVCTDDGMLVCYYSDDQDLVCSQKLVLKYSTDGINWSEAVDTVALKDHNLRPGMPVVTKMGNGKYIMVYEIVGMAGNPVYYKISDNPIDWGDPTDYGTLVKSSGKTLAATPWCTWIPFGGDCGMLMLTGWRMASGKSDTGSDIFVSFDYGDTWTTIPNYYSYKWSSDADTYGYSASIVASTDGQTIYYMANTPGDDVRVNAGGVTNWYRLYRIRVE